MEDDDEYFGSLMDKASSGDVVEYTWYECVEGFKQVDREMGSLFHLKLGWMNRAEANYFANNNKMAGFVKQFAEDCAISYHYASRINRARKSPHGAKNFSQHFVMELMSAPEELARHIPFQSFVVFTRMSGLSVSHPDPSFFCVRLLNPL